jgi:hypothetical protein
MIARWIDLCARNRFLVFTGTLLLVLAGIWAERQMPMDALPDISDVQVIIHTAWYEPPKCDRGSGHLPDRDRPACGAKREGGTRPDHVRRFLRARPRRSSGSWEPILALLRKEGPTPRLGLARGRFRKAFCRSRPPRGGYG